MLRRLDPFLALLLCILTFSVGCKHIPSVAEANLLLAGRWELFLGQDCQDYGVRSDTLILHSDGRLEQHFVSTYNQRYDSTTEQWSYSPDNSVNFDARRNFFSKQPPNEVIGVREHETLIVEFGNPPVILTNPHSNCLYRRVGNE